MTQPFAGRPRKEKPPFAPHSGRHWTRQEDAKMVELVCHGLFDDESGRVLGRSPSAVRSRRRHFHLDLVPRHRGEALVHAICHRVARDAVERLSERYDMAPRLVAGVLLSEALKADMAGRIEKALERARGGA